MCDEEIGEQIMHSRTYAEFSATFAIDKKTIECVNRYFEALDSSKQKNSGQTTLEFFGLTEEEYVEIILPRE